VLDLVDTLSYQRTDEKNNVRVCIHIREEEDGELWSTVNDGASTGN
jgi:hypothetical protein